MLPESPRLLCIGHAYMDFTTKVERLPQGDEKILAHGFACSFGGNAVGAAFTCQKLGVKTDLLAAHGYDDLGQMFLAKASAHGLQVYTREIERTSVSLVFPNADGTRCAIRARHDTSAYKQPIPPLDITAYQALHVDGHQPDAALYYAKLCRERGIQTSYDGGRIRPVTEELLDYIDVAIVSEEFCQGLGMSPADVLLYLRKKKCPSAGVTRNKKDILWYNSADIDGRRVYTEGELPVHHVPDERVVDSNGSGDVFHGAALFSLLRYPFLRLEAHLRFGSVAAALKLQHLGIEAGLPTLEEVKAEMPALEHVRADAMR